jgi:hypothetical protein
VELGRSAQGLAGADRADALSGMVDDRDGDGVTALSTPLQTRSYLLMCSQMAVLRFGAPDCPGSP